MFKIIFNITIACLFSLGLSAQGNTLEFNQAIHLENASSSSPQTFTVPAGKVWKITSFGGYSGRQAYTTSQTYYMQIGATYATNTIEGYASSSVSNCTSSRRGTTVSDVFWIPEGTVIELGFLTNSNSSCNSVYANGIEFNVVPN